MHIAPRRLLLAAGCMSLLCTFAPSCGEPDNDVAKTEIYASFPPLAQFAARMVGEGVPVICPIPESVDPHDWEPSAAEITLFQNATMMFVHGAELERWIQNASLPVARVVDVSAGLKDSYVQIVHPGHSHGSGGAGSHTHVDPHVWLDPTLGKRQVQVMHDAIVAKWPKLTDAAAAGLKQLQADYDTLDKRWSALRPKLAATKHYSAADSFGYLAKRYGFEFRDNLHVDATKDLGKEALDHLEGHIKDEGAKLLWWESEPIPAVKMALSERFGFSHFVMHTGERAGVVSGADYFDIQRKNLDRLAAALDG